MVTLSDIFIYPIKSTAGVRLQRAQLDTQGLAHDRRYLITDERGRFFTARRYPRMLLIQSTLHGEAIVVRAPGQPPLELDPSTFADRYDSVTVWSDTVSAQHCGPAANEWVSAFLGVAARIYYMGAASQRPAFDGQVSFADAAPLLLLSQASIDDLNSRLASPVDVRNFRPNLLVSGATAYAEDEWPDFSLGTAAFRVLHRCSRCILTTINPDTALLDRERQPLETLMQYRAEDEQALFGRNIGVASTGEIQIMQKLEFAPADT